MAQAQAQHVLVQTTAADKPAAEKIALTLVRQGLVAGAEISRIESVYLLDDEMRMTPEFRVTLTTRRALFDRVEAAIRDLQGDDTPALLMLEISGGAADFLEWIADATAEPEE